MEKINGFTEGEIFSLVAEVKDALARGAKLSDVFESFAEKNHRARGSVRNFYYYLVALSAKNERICKKYGLEQITVKRAVSFNESEADELLRTVFKGRAEGKSVRSIIAKMSMGDEKKMLRLQNKYRNLMNKERDFVSRVLKSMGETAPASFSPYEKRKNEDSFAIKRLSIEINSLVERISEGVKKENLALKGKLAMLENENTALKVKLEKWRGYSVKNGNDNS